MTDYIPSLVDPNRRVVREDGTSRISFTLTREGILRALGNAAEQGHSPSGHPLNSHLCVEAEECKTQLGADAVAIHQAIALLEAKDVVTRYRINAFGQKVNRMYDTVTAPLGAVTEKMRKEAAAFLMGVIGKEVTFLPYTLRKSHDGPTKQPQGPTPGRGNRKSVETWRRNGTGQSRAL